MCSANYRPHNLVIVPLILLTLLLLQKYLTSIPTSVETRYDGPTTQQITAHSIYPPLTSLPTGKCGPAQHPCIPIVNETGTCIVTVYTDITSYEFSYHSSVLFQSLSDCFVLIQSREDMPKRNATGVLIAGGGVSAWELECDLHRIILLDLSDEWLDHKPSIYARFAAVYRNYIPIKYVADETYLYPEITTPKIAWTVAPSRPFWFPLGFGRFQPRPSNFVIPLALRRYQWAWVGSVAGKTERQAFSTVVRNTKRSPKSFYMEFSTFNAGGLDIAHYTDLWYSTRFVPLPSGGNEEQFRIWEVIKSGCIPVFRKGNHMITLLHTLGFKLLEVKSWDDFMIQIIVWDKTSQSSPRFQTWQEHNSAALEKIYKKLADHIAVEIRKII